MARDDVASRRRQAADGVAGRAEDVNTQDGGVAVVEGPARRAYSDVIALDQIIIGLHPDLCAVARDHVARARRCSPDCVVATCGDADADGVAQIVAARVVRAYDVALGYV